eukprot:TRINITY_DN10294_c0_g1_i2.p1 TRINITY_DN10294_c0_g1~~TRINITY_DN10294_c0_g1_i2.p1  ORF type:complete len:635 (+),score=76.23 TRINITY_DN10294_c0_g1_i2:222-1907(+)
MLAGILVPVSLWCIIGLMSLRSSAKSDQQHDVFGVMIITWCVCAIVAFTACLFGGPTRLMAMPHTTEIIMLFLCTLAMVMQVPLDRGYVTTLSGFQNRQVWGPEADISDTRILLNLDVVLTTAHIMLPLRWHYLVFIQFGGIFLYLFTIFGIGSHSDQIESNLTCYVVLIFLASVGKRTLEVAQRRNFVLIIQEKTKRSEAEFRLNRATERNPEPPSCGLTDVVAPSQVESAQSTTLSSLTFGCEEISLSDVIQLGKNEQWLVEKEHIEVSTTSLAHGSFGTVAMAFYYGSSVAVKQCNPVVQTPASLAMSCNELRILRRLRHPHIVSFYGAIVNFGDCSITLVMELIHGHSLEDHIKADRTIDFTPTLTQKVFILSSLCGALEYLHTRSPSTVHGDMKPSNIMVERVDGCELGCIVNAKLVDFGLSRLISRQSKPLGGSPEWVAPEVVQLNGNTDLPTASDVYSLGRISFSFLTGTLDQRNPLDIVKSLRRGEVPKQCWPEDVMQDDRVQQLMPIVDACCLRTAIERPDILEVHQVMKKIDGQDICELVIESDCEGKATL